MPAYILTGARWSGKTAILRKLETLGYLVVEEAATDVIALENALGRDEETYRGLGFRLVDIPAGPLPDRVALIERAVEVCP